MPSTMDSTAHQACAFAKRLFDREQVPVYLYGAASLASSSASATQTSTSGLRVGAQATGWELKNVRRTLGYFCGSSSGDMVASSRYIQSALKEKVMSESVDAGAPAPVAAWRPTVYPHRKGVSCVGAVPLVLNFNVRFRPQDSRAKVQQITKYVRSQCPDVSMFVSSNIAPKYAVVDVQFICTYCLICHSWNKHSLRL